MISLATLDADLAAAEAEQAALRPGCAKCVIWVGEPARKTSVSVVFLHGFSASLGELAPLPQDVAARLGANLFLARLTGHGQDGAAMGRATLAAWQADVAEALEIGAALGERVIVMGCSTGCTLAALALAQKPAHVAGAVFISPNFGLRNKAAQLALDLPGSTRWMPWIIGAEREFPVKSADHAKYWTTHYPTKAVRPMAQAVRAARRAGIETVQTPLFMAVNPDDQVISPKAARDIAMRWAGPVQRVNLIQGPDDDAMGHIMAGDVFSPRQTAGLADKILTWARNL